MGRRHNFHDSGYKKLFSNPEMVRQLLTCFVDEKWLSMIEYNSLERIDKSFISDEFAERESDIIFRAQFSGRDIYIFILLEFQSTVDRFMALRMLRYILELYEYLVKNHRLRCLPAVFPVMLYNGEKRWTAPAAIDKLIEASIPELYIPRFRYYKIAENEFSREFLKKLGNSVAALFYTEGCSGEEMHDEINTIVDLIKDEKPGELSLFIHWFKYMFQQRPELVDEIRGIEEAKTMLKTSIEKYGKKIARKAELEGIEKGIQKGIQKGMQKGIQKKAIETARALLNEKMPMEKIALISGLSVDEIKRLK